MEILEFINIVSKIENSLNDIINRFQMLEKLANVKLYQQTVFKQQADSQGSVGQQPTG